MKIKLYMTALVLAIATPIVATAQFVPTIGTAQEFEFCADRPLRPEWIENIEPREAHKGQLVQMMYRAQSLSAVVESNSCPCQIRFPAWDEAQEYYYEHYSGLERFDTMQQTSQYRRTANDYSKIAKPICELENNW